MFLYLLAVGTVFGLIGLAIARSKGTSPAFAFWICGLLGPIGLIIVAVMPANQVNDPILAKQSEFTGDRNLANDAYRIWLTSRYQVSKNEVLAGYTCADRLFSSADEALNYANELHEVELSQKAAEAIVHKQNEDRKRKTGLVIAAVILALLMSFVAFALYREHTYEIKRDAARVEAAAREKDDQQANVTQQREQTDSANRQLTAFGFSIPALSINAKVEVDKQSYCQYVPKGVVEIRTIKGTSVSYETPDKTSGSMGDLLEQLRRAGFTKDRSDLIYDSSDMKLLSNTKTGIEVLVHEPNEYVSSRIISMCFNKGSREKALTSQTPVNPIEIASSPAFTVRERKIMDRYDTLNSECRGAVRTTPEALEATCEQRDAYSDVVFNAGLCLGREEQATFEFQWHRCDSQSYATQYHASKSGSE